MIVAGAVILHEVMTAFGLEEIEASERDILHWPPRLRSRRGESRLLDRVWSSGRPARLRAADDTRGFEMTTIADFDTEQFEALRASFSGIFCTRPTTPTTRRAGSTTA